MQTIKTRATNGGLTRNNVKYAPVNLRVIALSGGNYPSRASFALGELLEPVRALLSTRTSRAYVAIGRAELHPPPPLSFQDTDGLAPNLSVDVSGFRKTMVGSSAYPLPLGWAMSMRTGELIGEQSGRFWDCEPNLKFAQAAHSFAEADCIQLLTYHELHRSIDAAANDIIVAAYAQTLGGSQTQAPPRFDHEAFLGCYQRGLDQDIMAFQANMVRSLLEAWDRHVDLYDDRWLAYLMGTLAYDSLDFRLMSEFLSFASADRIAKLWPRRFKDATEAAKYVNDPKGLANYVYGYAGNSFENVQPDDGWRYRQRGVYRLIGREQYRDYGREMNIDLENHPELILNRDIGARVALTRFLIGHRGNLLVPYFNGTQGDWEGARKVESSSGEGAKQVAQKGQTLLACVHEAQGAPAQVSP